MQRVYGPESSENALRTAHAEIVAGVLRTPLAILEEDPVICRLSKCTNGSALTTGIGTCGGAI